MKIDILKLTEKEEAKRENGAPVYVRIKTEYPLINTGDVKTDSHLNEYYAKMAENLKKSAVLSACDMNVTCSVTYSDDELYSVVFDIKSYIEKELVGYRRISENRRKNGQMVYPGEVFMSKKKRRIEKFSISPDDWYMTQKGVSVFVCTFKSGDGKGLRRSAEPQFIKNFAVQEKDLMPEFSEKNS